MSQPASQTPDQATKRAGVWILGSWQDLALFVATPLLVLPLFGLVGTQVSVEKIALFVAAFGALGHHAPGMMRAYGDRALFERFKLRFILSPLFLLAIAVPFTMYEFHGLTVIVLLWGVWHGALQVYGFLRIYDAKAGAFRRWTAWLDWLLCLGWFGGGLLYSPGRMVSLVEAFYQGGGPLIATDAFHAFKTGWLAITIALSVAFVVNEFFDWRSGAPMSPVKPVSMAISFGFWWYTAVAVPSAILGVALFEVFHDVQYLSIVWLFNRNRVEKTPQTGFTRFLFRRSGAMIGLYVGICFVYGAIRFVPEFVALESVRRGFIGLVAASTLLHFYFDGFIWKVRETDTSEALGLKGATPIEPRQVLVPWMVHALKWSAFVIPVFFLANAQLHRLGGATATFAQYENMVELIPNSAYLRNNYGFQLKVRERLDEALAEYERAIFLAPDYARAHSNLGVALLQKGEVAKAEANFRRAVELEPDYAEAHTNLATVLASQNESKAAGEHYERALRLDPDLLEAHNGLAQLLVKRKEPERAIRHFGRAAALAPESSEIRTSLGLAFAIAGRREEALAAFDEALRMNPDDLVSLETSAWILATRADATEKDAREAVTRGERAAELTAYLNASILDTLGTAYAASGSFERAEVAARTASAVASDSGNQTLVRDIEKRILLYQRQQAFHDPKGPRP